MQFRVWLWACLAAGLTGVVDAGGPKIKTPTQAPTAQPTTTISPTTSTISPTTTYSPTIQSTISDAPTLKPTMYPGFPSAIGGVPLSVLIEIGVLVTLFVLFGCALGCGMLVHGKRRKQRKIDKIAAYEVERETKRELLRHTTEDGEEEIETKTMELLPDRDWDAEEEDEDDARPNFLIEVLLIVFPFLSVLEGVKHCLWVCCCKTGLVAKPEVNEDALDDAEKDGEERRRRTSSARRSSTLTASSSTPDQANTRNTFRAPRRTWCA